MVQKWSRASQNRVGMSVHTNIRSDTLRLYILAFPMAPINIKEKLNPFRSWL